MNTGRQSVSSCQNAKTTTSVLLFSGWTFTQPASTYFILRNDTDTRDKCTRTHILFPSDSTNSMSTKQFKNCLLSTLFLFSLILSMLMPAGLFSSEIT